MTIVAALYKNNEMWVMGDRMTTWGEYFQRTDSHNNGKFVRFRHAYIGIAGRILYANALQYWVDNQSKTRFKKHVNSHFKTESEVHDFFQEFFKFITEHYGLGAAASDDVAKMSNASFLLATPDSIYDVSACRDITTFKNYSAIGSGADTAIAAIDALYPVVKNPNEILTRAYVTTCKLISGCGGEMELINVTQALKGNTAKRGKTFVKKTFARK